MNPQIKANVQKLPTNYTSWVVIAVSAIAAWWLQLPPTVQAEYLAIYPWLKTVAPLAAVVSFVVARVWPQGIPTLEDEVDTQAQDIGTTGEKQ
jgi:hypothetical protein